LTVGKQNGDAHLIRGVLEYDFVFIALNKPWFIIVFVLDGAGHCEGMYFCCFSYTQLLFAFFQYVYLLWYKVHLLYFSRLLILFEFSFEHCYQGSAQGFLRKVNPMCGSMQCGFKPQKPPPRSTTHSTGKKAVPTQTLFTHRLRCHGKKENVEIYFTFAVYQAKFNLTPFRRTCFSPWIKLKEKTSSSKRIQSGVFHSWTEQSRPKQLLQKLWVSFLLSQFLISFFSNCKILPKHCKACFKILPIWRCCKSTLSRNRLINWSSLKKCKVGFASWKGKP